VLEHANLLVAEATTTALPARDLTKALELTMLIAREDPRVLTAAKYCRNGGMAFATIAAGGLRPAQSLPPPLRGVRRERATVPVVAPRIAHFAGEKTAGQGVRVLWGPAWSRLPF
jgi:hypothetical protein